MQRLIASRAAAELAAIQDQPVDQEADVDRARCLGERACGDGAETHAVRPANREVRGEGARFELEPKRA